MDEALIRLQEEELRRTGRYYKHICFLCVPLLCVSCYLYGPRPLLLCGFAVLMGNLCDRLISLLRRRVYQAGDYSNESFALVITLLMPATVDWYVLAAAILAGALIGKEVFGGYGSYPFHPAAVGYAVAAVSWPEQVFRYPAPYANIPLWGASGVATSSTISDTLRSGGLINISALSLVLGEYAAPMGTGAAIVLAACGLFLWMQKDVRLSASLSFLITAGLIVFFFPRQLGLTEGTAFTAGLVFRLRCVRDEMLTGAMLFSAVFLLNEPYTCAHHRLGRILYGVMVGAFTMGFRYFGVYETGVCFAILAVNSISGWLDRTEVRLYELIKSGRQFKEKKTGKGDAE
ncbi:MAG: RnfABCDGE type electron transport complex subunit D [Faecalibacterium prausnitzii]